MSIPLNTEGFQDPILNINKRKPVTESSAYFWRNITKGVQESTKSALTVDSGRRASVGTFKASKDFAKGDTICGSLCCVSIGCEVISGVLVWCPIPGKIVTVSALKATSIGCQKFRDLCTADPSSPLC
uniref:Uncharacterized protein n=1 Tax=Toxarium undulatum TaxID=210620 RepID=A0A1D8D9P4_9STRA|nr:hypothetical protein [Toxarium undulatum]AOS86676.1 hypothetical protein [Toxarium undulatum]